MTPANTSHSRAIVYGLFGRIMLSGLNENLIEALAPVPHLQEMAKKNFDPDQAAANHHSLFGMAVFPYASVFLDEEARLGGDVTTWVQDFYQQSGLRLDLSSSPADHIGNELHLLAFLSGAEADAWEDAKQGEIQKIQQKQQQFMDNHLLWWLPTFVEALREQNQPFYYELAQVALGLIVDHRKNIPYTSDVSEPKPSLPALPENLLDSPKTSLRDIARFLVTPAWTGFYLGRPEISALSKPGKLPHGFGGRALMMHNLLQSAATYDEFLPLLNRLSERNNHWKNYWQEFANQNTAIPVFDAISVLWLQRLAKVDEICLGIGTALNQAD